MTLRNDIATLRELVEKRRDIGPAHVLDAMVRILEDLDSRLVTLDVATDRLADSLHNSQVMTYIYRLEGVVYDKIPGLPSYQWYLTATVGFHSLKDAQRFAKKLLKGDITETVEMYFDYLSLNIDDFKRPAWAIGARSEYVYQFIPASGPPCRSYTYTALEEAGHFTPF